MKWLLLAATFALGCASTVEYVGGSSRGNTNTGGAPPASGEGASPSIGMTSGDAGAPSSPCGAVQCPAAPPLDGVVCGACPVHCSYQVATPCGPQIVGADCYGGSGLAAWHVKSPVCYGGYGGYGGVSVSAVSSTSSSGYGAGY